MGRMVVGGTMVRRRCANLVYFFFQAEDGIRDVAVTGVQTCALPILRNRGQQVVFAALVRARTQLPFPLLGIDSDNGGEFINAHLLRYCQAEQLTFTRRSEERRVGKECRSRWSPYH